MVVLPIIASRDTPESNATIPASPGLVRYREGVSPDDVMPEADAPERAKDAAIAPPDLADSVASTGPVTAEDAAVLSDSGAIAKFSDDAPVAHVDETSESTGGTLVVPPEPAESALFLDPDPAENARTIDQESAEGITEPEDPSDTLAAETDAASPRTEWADTRSPVTALAWLDLDDVAAGTRPATLDAPLRVGAGRGLLTDARLRPAISRPSVFLPLMALLVLGGGYVGSTLLWPLSHVAPQISVVSIETASASAAALTWPTVGSAAVNVSGVSSATSSTEQAPIASITKVATVLMALEQLPLQPGEQGPEFSFTQSDSTKYWQYLGNNQSALDVPTGGVLTEYQLLQGILIGSANNYADRLAEEVWGSTSAFAAAAAEWLPAHGLSGMTLVNPSGFDDRNVATPESLLTLAELALANPVVAEIVATPVAELPGAGTITNTNGMLADPGVVGVKTGTMAGWNLLTAKNVTIGDTTVRLNAAVLNQEDDEQRLAATRSLFAEVEAALTAQAPVVAQGTVVGTVRTAWGTDTEVTTDEDADVVLWNSASAQHSIDFTLGDDWDAGEDVGTLSVDGPVNDAVVAVSLDEDIPQPSAWWRLTHPLELFGLSEPSYD